MTELHNLSAATGVQRAEAEAQPLDQRGAGKSQDDWLPTADELDADTFGVNVDCPNVCDPDFHPGHGCAPLPQEATMVRHGEGRVQRQGFRDVRFRGAR